jgi:hypothetical protein
MRHFPANHGFVPPLGDARRVPALAELVATAGLALATIVAVMVITSGVARADVLDGVIGNEGGLFAIALIIGLAFIGMGSLTPPGGSRADKR